MFSGPASHYVKTIQLVKLHYVERRVVGLGSKFVFRDTNLAVKFSPVCKQIMHMRFKSGQAAIHFSLAPKERNTGGFWQAESPGRVLGQLFCKRLVICSSCCLLGIEHVQQVVVPAGFGKVGLPATELLDSRYTCPTHSMVLGDPVACVARGAAGSPQRPGRAKTRVHSLNFRVLAMF